MAYLNQPWFNRKIINTITLTTKSGTTKYLADETPVENRILRPIRGTAGVDTDSR